MTETLDSAELLVDESVQAFPVLQAAKAPDVSDAVPIESLRSADSPRLSGEDAGHTRVLQEILPDLPAILVNRRTMQVIDGMHRLSATRLAGEKTIRAEFVDTNERDAFLLAVKANTDHGLPLSVADREAAATRILSWYPYWSDRAIAATVGLAATTVGATRMRSSLQPAQSATRLGRDGRLRPVSTADGRRRAGEIIETRPGVSLREVAREAGISLGTAHDVRERLRRGENCVPDKQSELRSSGPCEQKPARRRRCGKQVAWPAVRERLQRDPALRYAEAGRLLLRWFDARAVNAGDWCGVIDAIPPHWVETMTNVAYSSGNEWYELAWALEQRRSSAMTDLPALNRTVPPPRLPVTPVPASP